MRGKRARQPMRRTTSLAEFSADALADAVSARAADARAHVGAPGTGAGAVAPAPPRAGRRNSVDYFVPAETAEFLRACGLCRRRLGPGRDTFMYRGDMAFCSQECRQQQMANDEWKEKCAALASSVKEMVQLHVVVPASAATSVAVAASAAATAASESGQGETVAAA